MSEATVVVYGNRRERRESESKSNDRGRRGGGGSDGNKQHNGTAYSSGHLILTPLLKLADKYRYDCVTGAKPIDDTVELDHILDEGTQNQLHNIFGLSQHHPEVMEVALAWVKGTHATRFLLAARSLSQSSGSYEQLHDMEVDANADTG
jgi:hypothetical protein